MTQNQIHHETLKIEKDAAPQKAVLPENGDINPLSVMSLITNKMQEIQARSMEEAEDESSEEEFIVTHGHVVYHDHDMRHRGSSLARDPMRKGSWTSKHILVDVIEHLKPYPSKDDFDEMNIVSKVLCLVNLIPMFFFKLTIPLNEVSWSKPVAIIHAFTCPITLLFAIQLVTFAPFGWSPGLWAYALGVSVVLTVLLILFTDLNEEPAYYEGISSYAGFLMSIAWIYLISSEVVNVVTMLGVVSRISHEILGLTILAWCNSIGDMVADVSVAKQGFPRMAMAAAIGGQLFNLLVGFGVPFSIAKASGKYISLENSPIYRLIMTFLGISLVFTLIGIFVQRFFLRRPHAIVLILIYALFFVFVGLSLGNVLVWN